MKRLSFSLIVIVAMIFLTACKNEKINFEVVFNNNGSRTVVVVSENERVAKPKDPVREGYTFEGWYTNLNNSEAYDFNKLVTKNFILYAKWTKNQVCQLTCKDGYTLVNPDSENCYCKKIESGENNKPATTKYTVKFETNGGSKVASQTVTSGSKVSAPTAPTKEGYKFVGWYLNNIFYNFNNKVTKNITLVAKWEKIETPTPEVPDTPNTPDNPGDNTPDNPSEEPKVELSYKVVEEKESSARQVRIYLTKNNEVVAGKADIVYINGKTTTVEIPIEGIQETDGIFKEIKNIKVD